MAEIYVPIDYSNVKDIIPLGEDIIYSTMCKANKVIERIIWITHVLLTENGLAFWQPGKKKKDPPELIYLEWHKIWTVWKKGVVVNISNRFPEKNMDMTFITLTLIPNPNFETKNKFKIRLNEFPRKFMPFLIEKKKAFLDSEKSTFLNSKQRDKLVHSIDLMKKKFDKKYK